MKPAAYLLKNLCAKRFLAGLMAVAVAMGMSMVSMASALTPRVKTGPCPELKRQAFPMGDNFLGRYINNNPTGDFTLKTNFGTIQTPLTPEQSINCTEVPSAFKVEMWADETNAGRMRSLMNFAFDERGRLWAVETFDYPNVILGPFAGHDRIVIFEDTDGDKVADLQKVFVSGLNIPQGIELTPQGVVIAMAPHIVLFEDNNGDDSADTPTGRILYTGFKKTDTHAAVEQLYYGMDNWLYASVGYNGGSVLGVNFQSGIVRMRTDTTKFEYYNPGTCNNSQFGMMEDGQVFTGSATCANHSMHGVIPGVPAKDITTYGNAIKAVTKDLVQGDMAGGFTAVTSHEFYTARLFPKEYWNRAAFFGEGTGHLVAVDFLNPSLSTWKATRVDSTPNLFASSDAWTAPIQIKMGPDGAVWILDWYSYLYLHNGMSPQGAGHAFEDPSLPYRSLRDRLRERIYRVVPANGIVDPILNLRNATPELLVATLGHSNMFWRTTAQKQILKRTVLQADKDKMETLLSGVLTKSWAKDAVGIDGYAIHAMWTAEGLGFFKKNPTTWDPILKALLLHPSPAVRMNVARAMPKTANSSAAIRDQCTVNATEPHVRLWALLALGEMPKTTGINILTAYHNLDTYSQQAFTKANAGAGIADIATAPTCPALHSVEPPVTLDRELKDVQQKGHIHFGFIRNGIWAPFPNTNPGVGALKVFSLQGKLVATSSFDGYSWSSSIAGLNQSLYTFIFQGRNGEQIQGRIFGN